MQANYVKIKLLQNSCLTQDSRHIKKLVSVNPYTLGLKNLMLAIVATDESEKTMLFEQALPNLRHIKYYYVEALLLYAGHLQTIGMNVEFEAIYKQGFDLACHHYYRWLRYQFESMRGEISTSYHPDLYPLPEQIDFASYSQWLIKKIGKDSKH
jgi:hypothetical protein